ncbi:MAG: MMPL family transporter, partial [Actinobacteria bacterium]|nr:MMPL family transporter [Actinomycetota bacterium]
MTLVAAIDTPEQLAAAQSVSQALASTPGVAFASPAVPNDAASPSAVLWTLYPTSAPQSEEAANLVSSLRDTVLPQAVGDSSLAVKVTGSVAVNVDFSGYLADRL